MKKQNEPIKQRKRRPILLKYGIGRGILISLIVLLTINIAVATPKIKFYDEPSPFIYDFIAKYDLVGVKWVLVFKENASLYLRGYYYPYQIRLWDYSEAVFVHELAHHYNYLETGDFISHSDNFQRINSALCNYGGINVSSCIQH